MAIVREIKSDKGKVCNEVLRALPKWFGIEAAIVNYVKDVETLVTFVSETESGSLAGFLSINFHNEFNAEIHVIGVLPGFHGQGHGKALVDMAEKYARDKGARYLTVKTISPARVNHEYEMTRKFYHSAGFVPLEEFKTLWGEANPCLLMIKSL
jgi:ribosomal protein S18 acetylase RimI-like enzyme